jgi:hypothetical protein
LLAGSLGLALATAPSLASDGPPSKLKSASAKAASSEAGSNTLSPGAERELRKKIQKAWRKREEELRTLLFLYVQKTTDGPERARQRRDMAELIKKRDAAPAKDRVKADRLLPIKLAEPCSLQLFAVRDSRLRSERWGRPSDQEARALLVGLTPGKDSDRADIDDGDRQYFLSPKNRGRDGTEFRCLTIQPHTGYFPNTSFQLFVLLDYHSSLAPNEWYSFDTARVAVSPPKDHEPSRVLVSFPTCDVWLDPSRDYLVTEILTWGKERTQKLKRTVCEYEKAPAPLGWVPKKVTGTWLPGTFLADTVEECVTVDWATGDDKVPKELFVFDSPDGTMIFDSTEDNGQTTRASIAWKGKLVPVDAARLYSESLERVKKGLPPMPANKK